MGAPKEVWVVLFPDGTMSLPTPRESNARDAASRGCGTVHRSVLAREKREPIAWVVRRESGTYLRENRWWTSNRDHATRYASSEEACKAMRESADQGHPSRVVALVRKP